MKKYTTKELRTNHYFILYDFNDNLILYIDNVAELSKYFHYNFCDIVRQFNRSNFDYIKVVVFGRFYKLYLFSD